MNLARALKVTTPADTAIVMTRVFDAPRLLVFDTWTKPELLARWYGAHGWTLVECDVDLRVDGAWRFVWRGPDGSTMGARGVYREIARPERLAYTEEFDEHWYPGESLVTHVLSEHNGTTMLTTTLLYPSKEVRDLVIESPMERGVAEGYDRLDELLAARLA
ncbi:SRPBCC family protein [soil metagenome]